MRGGTLRGHNPESAQYRRESLRGTMLGATLSACLPYSPPCYAFYSTLYAHEGTMPHHALATLMTLLQAIHQLASYRHAGRQNIAG